MTGCKKDNFDVDRIQIKGKLESGSKSKSLPGAKGVESATAIDLNSLTL